MTQVKAMSADTDKKTLELEVEGLCCTECAVSVEKTLTNRAGVDQVKILSDRGGSPEIVKGASPECLALHFATDSFGVCF